VWRDMTNYGTDWVGSLQSWEKSGSSHWPCGNHNHRPNFLFLEGMTAPIIPMKIITMRVCVLSGVVDSFPHHYNACHGPGWAWPTKAWPSPLTCRPGPQKPGPAHKSPARPTGPRARANLYYILTKMLLLTQTIR